MNNFGQPEFEDFEVVDGPTIPIDAIIRWCVERMNEYVVQKITMDTYRYQMFKTKFEEAGISIESKQNPAGLVRLVRRIGSACAKNKLWSVLHHAMVYKQYESEHGQIRKQDVRKNRTEVKEKRWIYGFRGGDVFEG